MFFITKNFDYEKAVFIILSSRIACMQQRVRHHRYDQYGHSCGPTGQHDEQGYINDDRHKYESSRFIVVLLPVVIVKVKNEKARKLPGFFFTHSANESRLIVLFHFLFCFPVNIVFRDLGKQAISFFFFLQRCRQDVSNFLVSHDRGK